MRWNKIKGYGGTHRFICFEFLSHDYLYTILVDLMYRTQEPANSSGNKINRKKKNWINIFNNYIPFILMLIKLKNVCTK